jgi:hypothetical protein
MGDFSDFERRQIVDALLAGACVMDYIESSGF